MQHYHNSIHMPGNSEYRLDNFCKIDPFGVFQCLILAIIFWGVNCVQNSIQGWRKQPGNGPAKLSTIPRITLLRGLGACPLGNFWKWDTQICYFWHIFTISMKYILYITLKVQAAQNVRIQNDLTWKQKNLKWSSQSNRTASTGPAITCNHLASCICQELCAASLCWLHRCCFSLNF